MVTLIPPETRAPRRIKMTYQEYLELAPDSQKVEWVDGEAIVYMPPITKHQRVSFFLSQLSGLFVDFFKLGEIIVAPLIH